MESSSVDSKQNPSISRHAYRLECSNMCLLTAAYNTFHFSFELNYDHMPTSPSGAESSRLFRRYVNTSYYTEYQHFSMPFVKRRKLSLEENNAGNNEGNRVETSNAVSLDVEKESCSAQAEGEQPSGSGGVEKRIGKRPRLESGDDGKDSQQFGVQPTPAIRSSTRIIKKKEKDICQPESPVKKPVKDPKSSTPDTKAGHSKKPVKRQWELWSLDDKNTFFEALFEYGKDFDSIHNLIMQKAKKKGIPTSMVKNKDQVRFFYYRNLQKISKLIHFNDEGIKKETLELYALINYGTLRKSIKRLILNEKTAPKLKELIFQGATTVRTNGKNKRIKTPCCNALKKLNNIDDGGEPEPVVIPEKIVLELKPKSNKAWARVQGMAQNPLVRVKVATDHSIGSIIAHLSRRWKSLRARQKEELESTYEAEKLTFFCTSDYPLHPHVLRPHKQPKINVTFENYRNNVLANLGSPNANNRKQAEDGTGAEDHMDGEVKVSPKNLSRSAKEAKAEDALSTATSAISELTILADDNAVFPDNPFSSESTPPKNCGEGVQSDSLEGPSGAMASGARTGKEGEGEGEDGGQEEERLDAESREIAEKIKQPLTVENSETLTVAQLVLVFGQRDTIRFEYDWVEPRPASSVVEVMTSQMTNMLRRLAHLASLEFSEFTQARMKQKNTPLDKSACVLCGLAPNRNSSGKKDSKNGRARPHHPKMRDASCNTPREFLPKVDPLPLNQQCVVMTKRDGEILSTPSAASVPGTMIGQLPNKVPSASSDGVFRVPMSVPMVRYKQTAIPNLSSQPMKPNFLVPRKRKFTKQQRRQQQLMMPQRTLLPKVHEVSVMALVPSIAGMTSVTDATPVAHTFSPANLATSQTIAITNLCVGGEAPSTAVPTVSAQNLLSTQLHSQQPLQVAVPVTAPFSCETVVTPSIPHSTHTVTPLQPLSIDTNHPVSTVALTITESAFAPSEIPDQTPLLLSPSSVGMATPMTTATATVASSGTLMAPSEGTLEKSLAALLEISLPETSNSVDAADKLLGLADRGFAGLLEERGGNSMDSGMRTPPLRTSDENSQMSMDMTPIKQLTCTLSADSQWLNNVTRALGLNGSLESPEKKNRVPVSASHIGFDLPFASENSTGELYTSLDNILGTSSSGKTISTASSTITSQTSPFSASTIIASTDDYSLGSMLDGKKGEAMTVSGAHSPTENFLISHDAPVLMSEASQDSLVQKLRSVEDLPASGDYSFGCILGSPVKKEAVPTTSVGSVFQPQPYFSEMSQDSIVNKFDMDIMLNENSMDYVKKIEPLAAHIDAGTDNSQSLDRMLAPGDKT